MARSRVYRHDVRCPDCGSNRMPRHGLDRGRQVYRCGDCGRRHTPDGAYRRPGPALKPRALEMYGEGSSFSAIGRVLGYSAAAVQQWVKRGATGPEGVAGRQPAAVVACGEMWTYRGRRKGESRENC